MAQIMALDHQTIDKIAAGEVVEKPASVVKELVENAIDSGATAISVEINNGGIELIRVTDNGCGIEQEQVPLAFLRHATSKITSVDDLLYLNTLGFRGEALASISAVSKVEMITKTKDAFIGYRFCVEGGEVTEQQEVGAPVGTTVIVRNLFYNTPARRKFLKSPATEGAYITELMQHLAMSMPNLSVKLTVNHLTRFHTSGNGDLKEVIYRIYGRDTAGSMMPIQYHIEGIDIEGYLGKPELARANRSYENYFINRRYVKSELIASGIEEAYKNHMMQHRFPFCALHINIDSTLLDVNVHPTKMEVRFSDQERLMSLLTQALRSTLEGKELIQEVHIEEEPEAIQPIEKTPEPFEEQRIKDLTISEIVEVNPIAQKIFGDDSISNSSPSTEIHANIIKQKDTVIVEKPEQMELFDDKMLTKEAKSQYHVLGQLFRTYWLIEYQDKLYLMDQHAAHEKVKYEQFVKRLESQSVVSQNLNPPIIVELQPVEENIFLANVAVFKQMGFEIDSFGGNEYAIRSVPLDLYACGEKELFLEVLDSLADNKVDTNNPDVILRKVASMACKAAVKGNQAMSEKELIALLDQMLELDNPYNCPHGRPTMISMSKYEIEKKFKRVVS